MFIVIATIWFIPGFLILGTFVGAWQAIHLTLWINLIPVVSFLFWVVALIAVRKCFLFLKRYKNRHKCNN